MMKSRPSSSSSSSSSISRAGNGGYQNLREKIISLGLEIEDRQKLRETLKAKVEEGAVLLPSLYAHISNAFVSSSIYEHTERVTMSNVERSISNEFQHVMDVENENFRAENDRLVKLGISNELSHL